MHGECNKFLEKFNSLGIKINNPDNITIAFTHSSYSSENYERFEFLGDSVLKLVISKYLFDKYKNEREGRLTQIRSVLVADKTLTIFAKKLEFQNYVRLGKGEKKTGRAMDTFLACVFEAVLGVFYVEFGNKKALDVAYKFIFDNFKEEIEKIEAEIDFSNPKATLQEYSQSNYHELPQYNLIEEKGLAHEKTFKINVDINGQSFKPAIGKSKKEAQKLAAKNALKELNLINEEES